MKSSIYVLAAIAVGLISCERADIREGIFAEPKPCRVEAVYANIGSVGINSEYGTPEICDVDDNVESRYLNISVLTFDSIIGWKGERLGFSAGIGQGVISSEGLYCKERIPEVEQHIHDWAEAQNEKSDPIWTKLSKDKAYLSCYFFPYRLDGVKSLTITANVSFNGIESGQDISDLFVISQFSPQLVFSYKDYSVHKFAGKEVPISQWLQLSPLASPCILLKLKDGAQEPVEDITFTVTMTLENGKVLASTTPAVDVVN